MATLTFMNPCRRKYLSVCAYVIMLCVSYLVYSLFVKHSSRYSEDNELKSGLRATDEWPGDAIMQCIRLNQAKTEISTVQQFSMFEFQAPWIKNKGIWDANFERRFIDSQEKKNELPLKVILMPHSHNDPGWRNTFSEYYSIHTSRILNNLLTKMEKYTNMTFIWAEVAFLSHWFDRIGDRDQNRFKRLVQSGRLEIVTGGWVMTDEANVDLYAMVSQLIEGHQWVWNNLNIKPGSGWSIDPFGHGSTVPYLLKESGIDSTVIQRIHYAWKYWFAMKQKSDFTWRQIWDTTGETDVLTHNLPYPIYSIRHSCGPDPKICINFDFRKVRGQVTDYSMVAEFINKENIKRKADLLIEQYKRTGSLFRDKVVLVPIGDDFRYDFPTEWDQQYINYQLLMNYINGNPSYHVEMQWGTIKDYFTAIRERAESFPKLKGDFFVYGDIFTDGNPGYWSGYFTTRPSWKLLSRQLESTLSIAEFTYTFALGTMAKSNLKDITLLLKKDYKMLVSARRQLSLFQHHDAITGTSKSYVMKDYADRLHDGIQQATEVLRHASLVVLSTDATLVKLKDKIFTGNYLNPIFKRSLQDGSVKTKLISIQKSKRQLVFTNSLAQRRYEVIKITVTSLNVKLTNELGHDIPFQINPVWATTGKGMVILPSEFDLYFIADLPPLSLVTYLLYMIPNEIPQSYLSTIYSNFYATSKEGDKIRSPFQMKDVPSNDILLESDRMKLLFNGTTGLLHSVTNKYTGHIIQLSMKYASYPSAKFKSGAYLFKPDPNAREPEQNVLFGAKPRIFIESGSIFSELTVMFGSILMHSFRVFHVSYEPLASGIYMENSFNLGGTYDRNETPGFSPHFRETELFFRFMTNVNNGADSRFYTDASGLGMQERTRVERIGIQGNYYPVTKGTFLEDEVNETERRRVTLLVDRAAGVASWKTGYLEAMVERRTLSDDSRGVEEGVKDQKRTQGRYWLLIENLQGSEDVPQLSLAAHHLSNSLNFPSVPLILEGLESDSLKSAAYFLTRPFPCSLNLLTIRTLSEPRYPGLMPLNKAMMVIQHQSSSCIAKSSVSSCRGIGDAFVPETNFSLAVTDMQETDLTGITKKRQLASLSDLVVPHHQLRSVVVTIS